MWQLLGLLHSVNVVFLVLDSTFNNHVSIQLSCLITKPELHHLIRSLWLYLRTHSLLLFTIEFILVNVSAIPLVPLHILCVVELCLCYFSMDSSCFWSRHMVKGFPLMALFDTNEKHYIINTFFFRFFSFQNL